MPKYVCPECKRIYIRNAAEIRLLNPKLKSYCMELGKMVTLKRLRIRRRK